MDLLLKYSTGMRKGERPMIKGEEEEEEEAH
jgi:hypothetical protein